MPLRSRGFDFMSCRRRTFQFVSELNALRFRLHVLSGRRLSRPSCRVHVGQCARWFLAAAGLHLFVGMGGLMPTLSAPLCSEALSRCIGAATGAPRSTTAHLCWRLEPADERFAAGPVSLGGLGTGPGNQRRPRPPSYKRVSHGSLLTCFVALPTQTRKQDDASSA